MERIREKIKLLPKGNNKLLIAVIIVLALALPFIINQVLKQQDLRQRANSNPPLIFEFEPPSDSLQVGYIKQFNLVVTTDVNNVGSVKLKLTYDPSIVKITASYPSALKEFDSENNNGIYSVTLLNIKDTAVTGSKVKIITFDVEGLKVGSTSLKIDSVNATVEGNDNYALVSDASKKEVYINVTTVQPTLNPGTPVVSEAPSSPPRVVDDSPTPPSPTSTPVPTATYMPTPTPVPGDSLLNVKIQLPGIGSASEQRLNATPLHPQRNGLVEILNESNSTILTTTGIFNYNPSTSAYEGQFSVSKNDATPSAAYSIRVSVKNSLKKIFPGQIQIYPDKTTDQKIPPVTLTTGDLNEDNILGIIDWTFMIACVKKESTCTSELMDLADLNDNGRVDEFDVQILQRGFAIREGD